MYDHRKLGRELEIFDTDPLIGAGLPYWLPAGAEIRHALEEYVRELERRAGYQHVYSPVLGKRELYELSGHWQHYQDGMYPPMVLGSEQLVLRPSLCPHHALMYRHRARSYRDLPLRMAELGGQYRSELSGVLGGLTRVRGMQLNDAHIFCTLDQVAAEAGSALAMIREAHRALGVEPARYRLSLASASAKYAGSPQMWADATAMLAKVLASSGLPYEAEEGEAAFYGLLPARPVPAGIHRRRRRPPPASDGAPQRDRQRRASSRPSARHQWRGIPTLAGSRPAGGLADLPRPVAAGRCVREAGDRAGIAR
jgi:threonyl-tRNA synthetase